MEFPTIDKFAKEVAEKALDEITYKGKTVREWAEIIVNQHLSEDCISRADAKKYLSAPDANGDRVIYESDLDLLPPVTPERPNPDMIETIKRKIDEMTEIHSDGEFYIKNVDVKWIINKYAYGDGGEEDDVS